MLKVNEFRAYITAIKEAIAEITVAETVIDDSQLAKFLQSQKGDTHLILGIIPKHNLSGGFDDLKSTDRTSILILEKVTRNNNSHQDFLDRIHNAQTVTQLVIDKLLLDANDDDRCDFIRYLEPSSFDINPIWGLNSCDGYQIDFSFKTTF
jgi:hypothetical protein